MSAWVHIEKAAAEVNLQLPEDRKLNPWPETVVLGDGGVLDSLGLVTFLVSLEQALAASGKTLPLAQNLATLQEDGVLGTLQSLCDYLEQQGA